MHGTSTAVFAGAQGVPLRPPPVATPVSVAAFGARYTPRAEDLPSYKFAASRRGSPDTYQMTRPGISQAQRHAQAVQAARRMVAPGGSPGLPAPARPGRLVGGRRTTRPIAQPAAVSASGCVPDRSSVTVAGPRDSRVRGAVSTVRSGAGVCTMPRISSAIWIRSR